MGGDAPEPPDPKETSSAQTGTSVATSIANAWLGNTNRVGPDGTTTWNQSGATTMHDPYTGETYNIPRFTETVTLSPEQQAIYDKTNAAKGNMADLASQQSSFLKDYMAQPVSLDNEATESRLFELGRKRLDPLMAQRDEALRTRLANQGIFDGSEAYNREVGRLGEQENDAYNSLMLSGRGQAVQEALAERNQPINEITALLSGSQVSQPQFSGQQQPQIPITDNAGLINNHYQQQLQGYQMEQQQMGGLMGGLFGLGGKIIGLSDAREKTDIRRVGTLDNGLGVYAYRYTSGGPTQIGVLAQEVETANPEAVLHFGDTLFVDYGKAVA